MKYRPDIDGLRALAVVPVIFYHAGLPVFSGGFAGVDVFFVISGYLMALMIGDGLARGDFSFADFYERRVRRIFPALFAILFFCAVVAAVIVPPKLYGDFGVTLVATVLFSSNILFWGKTANYFDAPTELNPLLHTWSLAVEEQFYIVFPVFLWLVWRSGPRARLALTALVAVLSFALSVWGTANAPTATFYLLPMRAWELLLGAMVALWMLRVPPATQSSPWASHIGGVAGLLLVISSLLWFDREMAFPGAAALIPCAGAALLIHFGRTSDSAAARVLALPPLVFVGQISYSLYLWHWPLLVFVDKYQLAGSSGVFQKTLVIAVSFLAAWLSWRWVEQPFRRRRAAPSRGQLFGAAIACSGVLAGAGLLVHSNHGWPGRFPGIESVSMEKQVFTEQTVKGWQAFSAQNCFLDRAPAWDGERCFLSRHARSNALLWGDSFAASYAYGFFQNEAAPFNVLQYTAPSCPPVFGYHAASRPQCTSFNEAVADVIKRHNISTVIMAAGWVNYLRRKKMSIEDIRATASTLRSLGVRVIVVGQSPLFTFTYPDEYFFLAFGAQQAERSYYAPVDLDPAINARIAPAASGNVFFDPLAVLCNEAQCLFRQGTRYLFSDYGHYTGYGSRRVVDELLRKTETSTH